MFDANSIWWFISLLSLNFDQIVHAVCRLADSTEGQSRQDRQAEVMQEPANQQASEADSSRKQSLPSKKVSDAVQ